MNHFLKIILLLSVTITFFSCNDEFLNEKPDISGVAASAIIISPEWEADDYEFICEGVGNADFTITSKPEWLILDSQSGKFTDSIATIHGSANAEPDFSKTGVYIDQMMVKVSGKIYAVPVYYITEGNPAVEVTSTFEISYNGSNNSIRITNAGEGILLWDIVSMPDWLTVNMSQFNPQSLIVGQGSYANIPFTFNIQAAVQNNLNGTIVLKTNDKNNPLVEIAVSALLGTPDLYFFDKQMEFGSSATTKTTRIYNQNSGMLIWSFEGLPEWLTVSTASGILDSYSSTDDITFTCNRALLQPGLNTATFHLKTNDTNEPSVTVTVSVRIPGYGVNIKALEGNIVEATFDKNTNTLYYVTGQPNKLVAYDVTAKSVVHEVSLSKAPTCLAIDETYQHALVGHGGSISNVDLSSFQVSNTFELNTTVYDVEWTKEEWFCYTNIPAAAPIYRGSMPAPVKPTGHPRPQTIIHQELPI